MFPVVPFFGISISVGISFIALGLFLSAVLLLHILRKSRLSPLFFVRIFLPLFLVFFISGRLFAGALLGFSFFDYFSVHTFSSFHMPIGFLFFCGALFYLCRKSHESLGKWCDVLFLVATFFSFFIFIAAASSGYLMGSPTSLPIGVMLTHPASAVITAEPVHPAGIYFAIAALCMFLIYAPLPFKQPPGLTAAVITLTAAVLWLIVDFFAFSERVFTFSSSFGYALMFAFASIVSIFYISRKQRSSFSFSP